MTELLKVGGAEVSCVKESFPLLPFLQAVVSEKAHGHFAIGGSLSSFALVWGDYPVGLYCVRVDFGLGAVNGPACKLGALLDRRERLEHPHTRCTSTIAALRSLLRDSKIWRRGAILCPIGVGARNHGEDVRDDRDRPGALPPGRCRCDRMAQTCRIDSKV